MATELLGRGRISRDALALLMSTPGQELHTREIARRIKADGHPVQRALERMLDAGLVQSRRLGNLRLWSVAEDNAVVPAARDLIRRTAGLAERLRATLSGMRSVHFAFLFGSYAAGEDKLGSDIDLFVVGSPDWKNLSAELATRSAHLGREINPVVWTAEQLESPTVKQRVFIDGLLHKPRIWLVGDDHELERFRFGMGTKVDRSAARQAHARGPRKRPSEARTRRGQR
ncbi:MAG: hypothetical protein E6J13_15015 [Chloroflexi bacterium]|nr:MAG: hypothetical protein E6J13_15015 [Chloroflexota bacterium]